jgi:hypothetical protein
MFRKNFLGTSVLVLGLALLASAPALASNKASVTLYHDAVLQGTSLQAGHYTVRWESHSPTATVTLSQGKHSRATAQAKLVERDHKYNCNSVVFETQADGTRNMREIRFAGSSQVIVFYE